jgi:hypothetical protein
MNGSTTMITRAADLAVSKGIVVVNSAGNEGSNTIHNTLIAPADGDSVLTVGAVTSAGTRSSFSSVGPTTSVPARIKPDVMALGSSVRVASSTITTGYTTASGTSFSCPLAAGVAALVVHARPNATPVQIMNSMRSTASRAATPDNLYGWGILDALAAINGIPLPIQLVYFTATIVNNSQGVRLDWGTLSEVNNYGFAIQRRGENQTEFASLPGVFIPGHGTTNDPQRYCYTDSQATSGVWRYRLKQFDLDGTVHYSDAIRVDILMGMQENAMPSEFFVSQAFPSPANPSTKIEYGLPHSMFVTLTVYNALGQQESQLVNEQQQPGYHDVVFRGDGLASGVYFYRIQAGDFTATKKLVLLK